MFIFTFIGFITVCVGIGFLVMEMIRFIGWKFSKRCYKCGDDTEKTYRVGEDFYCGTCLGIEKKGRKFNGN